MKNKIPNRFGAIPPLSSPVFSAKGAVLYQPGVTPQERGAKQMRAESPSHAPEIDRAFSAQNQNGPFSWGVAPGWNSAAPLALRRSSFVLCLIAFGLFLLSTAPVFSQSITISTLAGYAGRNGNDGSGANARFNHPHGLAV